MTIPTFGNKVAISIKASSIAVTSFLVHASAWAAAPNAMMNGINNAQPDGATNSLPTTFVNISNTLVYLVGATAVIFLIVGGLRYVVSNGNPKNVTAAKDTIMYALIGLVVAILAYAIVSYIAGQIK
jgi:hypothetical protein